MDIEFHYYLTGIIAHRAGFTTDEARIIAYSSQFVDDNHVILNVKEKGDGEVYSNYISQTMDILKPRRTLMRIYPVFHFVPGDPMAPFARRRDGKMHILNTTPDGEIANLMVSEAFKALPELRPYRIGIATHAYVDTWAHQNFAGINDSFNGDMLNPIPNIGHAENKNHPDWISHRWEDERLLESDIDNNVRFISAAKTLFQKYCENLGHKASWSDLQKDLLLAVDRSKPGHHPYGQEGRLERYSQMAEWLPPYDEDVWFDEAIDRKVVGLEDPHNEFLDRFTVLKDEYWWKKEVEKEQTHWFRFQEAVKGHQAFALTPINEKFKYMGIKV